MRVIPLQRIEADVEHNNDPRTNFLKVSGFQSIKTKILLFVLLATMVPSLILGGLFYLQNSKLLRAKISNDMRNATVQAGTKLDAWIKDRLYDLKVFSSSYVISENVARLESDRYSKLEVQVALNHVKGYLQSVRDKFSVYNELFLIDLAGNPVVTSASEGLADALPRHWIAKLDMNKPIVAETYYDVHTASKNLLMAEAIKAADGRTLGFLAAKIDLKSISPVLQRYSVGGIDELFLVNAKGRLLVSSKPEPEEFFIVMTDTLLDAKKNQAKALEQYISHHDKAVVGMATPIPSMDWTMVAEMEHRSAFADIVMLRRVTTTVVGGLMLSIGALAYLFGHALVRPVRRLSEEAAAVASGNLDVDIPVTGLSEVSYLTQVFNHMVASLRRGRERLSAANNALRETNKELHLLSITDGLTGLFNHKHIMELLDREISRSMRYGHPVSVLMLDIDHFKKINDTHGHQTGDVMMRELADLFNRMVRNSDYVGRYGGEEFLIVLHDSDAESSADTAERIRQKVQDLEVTINQEKISVTISIGVAGYPINGKDADTVISAADKALYQAKSGGRNRIVVHSDCGDCRESAVIHLHAERKRASKD
jgi:diguanylate cyclase (GGDEF)-like protein